MEYGLKEFKELMEKRFEDAKNPMNIPCTIMPGSDLANFYIQIKRETYRDVLEQFPESIGISRHSKRLIEQQRSEIELLQNQLAEYIRNRSL